MTTQHTPTPWQLVGPHQEATHIIAMPEIAAKQGESVAWVTAKLERGEGPANAARIVLCVNMHDELVAALQYAEGTLQMLADDKVLGAYGTLQVVRSALAKLEQ